LIEEYGDEWGNKPMFHYRWFYEPDQRSAAERIARSMMPGVGDAEVSGAIDMVKSRMIERLSFVGSSAATKDTIESSFRRQLAILERHLASRPFLFGGRPAFADFGLWGQLYQCASDPTPSEVMRVSAPRVLAWTQRMVDPRAGGDFEQWDELAPTIMPLLREEVGGVFLPWSAANDEAIAGGRKTFSLTLGGAPFTQETQKYHAKSLAVVRARYAAIADRSELDPILDQAGCRTWLDAENNRGAR
jgi:glutathione S-transferase